jgi:DNA (cytosine-5)-methyltransferase 1
MHFDSSAPFYEFFCGAGMARLGLAPAFACAFANDVSEHKAKTYAAAHGADHLRVADVWSLEASDLPGRAALAWASSPCQDLSAAGKRAGLAGARSGAFWGFWRLIQALEAERRAPPVIVLENVTGLFTSHGGADFNAIVEAIAGLGYAVGAVELDAAWFLPQSRPRAFIVAARAARSDLICPSPQGPAHSRAVTAAAARLGPAAAKAWRWWRLPAPPRRNVALADLLEPSASVRWRTPAQTAALLGLMAPGQRQKVAALQQVGAMAIGAGFRRMRLVEGQKQQRFEVRFDGLAGCVRTPGGGSSRQFVMHIEDNAVRTRSLTPRETARLMGLSDDFPLPAAQGHALHVTGDGVAVPVARFLSENLLAPLAGLARAPRGEIL